MSERIQKLERDGQTFLHREQPSKVWQPMRLCPGAESFRGTEHWENCFYYATAERFAAGFPIGEGPYVRIGISSIDEKAHHDWRDFQCIKNDICGPEWEAVELYPAESRLFDPSNRFYLWCVPSGVLRIGMFGDRRVWDIDDPNAMAPQRPFPRKTK